MCWDRLMDSFQNWREGETSGHRSRDRKHCIKDLIKARQALAAAQARYLGCLRSTGSALAGFTRAESNLQCVHPLLLPQEQNQESLSEEDEVVGVVTGRRWYSLTDIMRGIYYGFQKAAGSGEELSIMLAQCSIAETLLLAWEKKLYREIKKERLVNIEHKRMGLKNVLFLGKKNKKPQQEEKLKKVEEKLESQLNVSSKIIQAFSSEITRVRDGELYTEVLEQVVGLMRMWSSMCKWHEKQSRINEEQLKYLLIPSPEAELPEAEAEVEPTSLERYTVQLEREMVQLEREIQKWLLSFCSLVASQQDYIQSIIRWLRLSLFLDSNNNSSSSSSLPPPLLSLCEEWNQAIGRIPDGAAATEGIKHLLTLVHASKVVQEREQKKRKKSLSVFKELEKERYALLLQKPMYKLDSSCRSWIKSNSADVEDKLAPLKARMKEEKTKQAKSIYLTRITALRNLQTGLSHAIHALVCFSRACKDAFECKATTTTTPTQQATMNQTR